MTKRKNPKLIVITGYLAAGKSTFARMLSEAVSVPCIIKDTFKIALCESVVVTTREESSHFSTVTFDGMIYVAERLIEAGYPIIIEGNFVPAGLKKVDEAEVIRSLIEKHGCRALVYKFTGDTRILHQRYIERANSSERGQVYNIGGGSILYKDFEKYCRNLDAFDIGVKTIEVDTSCFEHVDYQGLITVARAFLHGELCP